MRNLFRKKKSPHLKKIRSVVLGKKLQNIVVKGGCLHLTSLDNRMRTMRENDAVAIGDPVKVGKSPAGIAVNNKGIAFVVNFLECSASFVRLQDGFVIKTIPVGKNPYGCTAANGYFFVTNSGDGTVSIIDEKTMKVVAIIPVGNKPCGVSELNNYLYVANYDDDTVSEICLQDMIRTRDIVAGKNPEGVESGKDHIYVTNFNGGSVLKINPITDDVGIVSVKGNPTGMAVAEEFVYVANWCGYVSVIHIKNWRIVDRIPANECSYGIDVSYKYLHVVDSSVGAMTSFLLNKEFCCE